MTSPLPNNDREISSQLLPTTTSLHKSRQAGASPNETHQSNKALMVSKSDVDHNTSSSRLIKTNAADFRTATTSIHHLKKSDVSDVSTVLSDNLINGLKKWNWKTDDNHDHSKSNKSKEGRSLSPNMS